ncbi:hypothetical protein ACJMK2_019628 [Sinanodonta woodiana]|uniref:Ferric-chelate reductase 1 n=1 Tax=Sinanodonta woodiana TaxID=1069815 RepID=A0ABD3TWT3_SINWO
MTRVKGKIMDCRQILAKSFLLGILLLGQVMCYPSGAPDIVCSSMIPNHGVSANNSAAPYTITTSKSTYKSNEEITVTIQANSGLYFMGFFIQPRKNGSISQPDTVGTLTGDSLTKNPCVTSSQAALTHINKTVKYSVNMTWRAPAEALDTVVFVATIVQSKFVYWVNVKSPEVTPLFYDPACGKTISCFHGNTFLITWAVNGSYVDFEMKASIPDPDNYWMSLGFSSDKYMGDDSVVDCSLQSGSVRSYSSYNQGRSNAPLDNNVYGIIGRGGSLQNGIFTCSFSRAIKVEAKRKKRAAASATTFFDLNENWYLFFAQGKGPATAKSQHTIPPMISDTKTNLLTISDLTAPEESSTGVDLALVHGSLMIVAWIFLASIGTVTARFYKSVCPESKLCSEKVWFQIHRACMVLVLFLVAAGFIVIFVEVRSYSETGGWTDLQRAHPILGIIIMALTIINPFMALFRPHPDAPSRKFFNVAHFAVGIVAFVLAIINIFIGADLEKLPKNVVNLLWAYVAWFIFIVLVLEQDFIQSRKEKGGNSYELNDLPEKETSGGSTSIIHKLKPGILAIHAVIVLGLTVAMLVLVNLSEES